MSLPEEKYCNGCVCKSCKKSEVNGALFVCNSNGCSACSETDGFCKLQYCTELVPYETEHTDDLRL